MEKNTEKKRNKSVSGSSKQKVQYRQTGLLGKHDTGKDTPGVNPLSTGRKEICIIGISANSGQFDVFLTDSRRKQLQTIGFPQVDMPFRIAAGNVLHRETSRSEGFVNFVAYLERLLRYARTDTRHHVSRVRPVGFRHGAQSLFYNPLHRSAPSGMNGSYHPAADIET